ncbi:integrase arm-type DNA-binding domain-containing protein [Sinirhodobacter sp. WL0062]|uniref:Integrase arm-type DNA-binding domain-containing protein n=1 Tax=Rhodobacter flavimaris TaxID=2907145 RepID=A0ABS8YRU3_9RHOB|nr:integrase arm-type DNA-binding domain-containing protein [Sinirhodobacter sp. WL0062]MCE5972599.1 integrase arm-type DNA-binding domain-containing protein [Sinirhodobacter sp. WL0062]
MSKLSALQIKNATPGKYEDGHGLRLIKREDGGGQWVYRYMLNGRRREMGLGGLGPISLKDARELASGFRTLVAKGIDPIKYREQQRREAARNEHLLKDVAHDAFESRKASLKGDGIAGRWFSPLELHVLPKLGKKPVSQIDQQDIRATLEPIWHTKASTAQKAADRLKIVIDHAAALGLDVDLQVVAKAKRLLGHQRHEIKSIPSMPWSEVPDFYATLEEPTVTHLALRLLILTGARSKPIRFARLEEFDGNVWTIPAANMKARVGAERDYRIPLSHEAIRVIELAQRMERGGYLFPSSRRGVISDATMARLMERQGLDARPHGFRSSLRTWLAEMTDAPHEVAEAMLAHMSESKVVRTYRQTDYLDRRRLLLQEWADFCTSKSAPEAR